MNNYNGIARLPLVVVIGPTASGKTAFAVKAAKKYGGEIICADSRSVFRGMDIGTAKPSKLEQSTIPHWGIDLVDPGEPYSAADFKKYALEKIDEIRSRKKIPFLVGGSGLYVDSVIFDYKFGDKADPKERARLDSMTLEQLWGYCDKNSIVLPENYHNKRYVTRNIERKNTSAPRRNELIKHTYVVGISTDRTILRSRIQQRIEQLFDAGVVNEAKKLGKKYGWATESFKGNIYRIVKLYLDDQVSLAEAKVRASTLDWRLAKRQLTWFKRNKFIQWGSAGELEIFLDRLLAK